LSGHTLVAGSDRLQLQSRTALIRGSTLVLAAWRRARAVPGHARRARCVAGHVSNGRHSGSECLGVDTPGSIFLVPRRGECSAKALPELACQVATPRSRIVVRLRRLRPRPDRPARRAGRAPDRAPANHQPTATSCRPGRLGRSPRRMGPGLRPLMVSGIRPGREVPHRVAEFTPSLLAGPDGHFAVRLECRAPRLQLAIAGLGLRVDA
jgi:hypothetical protein